MPYQRYLFKKIERIQNLALRFTYSSYSRFASISALREKANLKTLAHRRILSRLKFIYQLYHGHFKIPPNRYITNPSVRFDRIHHNKTDNHSVIWTFISTHYSLMLFDYGTSYLRRSLMQTRHNRLPISSITYHLIFNMQYIMFFISVEIFRISVWMPLLLCFIYNLPEVENLFLYHVLYFLIFLYSVLSLTFVTHSCLGPNRACSICK